MYLKESITTEDSLDMHPEKYELLDPQDARLSQLGKIDG